MDIFRTVFLIIWKRSKEFCLCVAFRVKSKHICDDKNRQDSSSAHHSNKVVKFLCALVMLEHRITVIITLSLLLYFMWMDIALFYYVHNRTTGRILENAKSPSTTTSTPELISPFTGLSVKMMMMDQVNNYIHTPLAHMFNEVTHFSTVFYFITPNMVSFVGLLFAIGAAKCMSMETRIFHYIAIFLFQMRTWFDALDGIVARSRLGMVQHVSLRNTSGYVVDGVADTLGFAAFLVGCFYYLRATAHKHKHYLPLNSADTFGEGKNGNSASQHSNSVTSTTRRVFFVVLCFGLQLALSAFFWDHYINAYHNLLESTASSQPQLDAQNKVLSSSVTWILMWFWRISNAHTLIQMLLFAIYIDRLWEFLTWIQYVGFAQILTLAFFTEIHLSTVHSYVVKVS